MKKEIQFVGHNLKTFAGTEQVTRADGSLKERNVWENHGLFASREFAANFARKSRAGKRYHISGVRLDVTPIEPPRREGK